MATRWFSFQSFSAVILATAATTAAHGQTIVDSTWDGSTSVWSATAHWDLLGGVDPYPDNNASYEYNVYLPTNAVAYTLSVDMPACDLLSVDVDAVATLLLTSTDFRPGSLTNLGVVELANDDLYLTQPIVNDGMIRFDADTSAEYIRVQQQDVTLSGTGTLLFPDISTTSTSVHYVYGARLLTNGPDHTIEGGPGTINDGLVNNGTVRANVPGKTLQLNDEIFENDGLMEAVGGGRLYFTSVDEIENSGAITCDASSVIELYNTHTALAGVVTIDGILQGTSSSITFDGTTGSGTGSFITNNSVTFATGTTIEFGTVDHSYTIAVHDGATVTVVDQYTHSLTTESYHNFNATGALRVIGGTAAAPDQYEDFASIEIAGRDVGGGSGGFIDNFDLPRLVIGPAAKVNLFDTVTNGNRGGPGGSAEALYVGTVEFEDPDGIINLNGYHLYYSTLIGNTSQIVDSGSGTGQYTPSWVCQTGNWSNPTCWSELDPGDPHPDNTTRTSYDVTLPPNGGVPYTVIVDGGAPDTEVIGVSLSVDTTLTLTSTNFRPGLLSNSGVVELTNDYLYLTQPIVNDGMIRFDTDTSAEYIRVQQQDVTLSGTGTLLFPDISTTSTSVHYVYGARLLTNGPDHTIEGGPGTIDDGLVNNGTVRANVPGKTLQLNDQIVENNGLVEAVGGGRLYFTSVDEIENSGAITCDASSVIELYNTHTALAGVVTIDGILQGTSSSITFDGTTGSGTGSFITNNSVTFATGTTIEFGTVDHSYTIAVHDGATVTVVDQYTHSLTTESYHNFNATGALRVIGGTAAAPDQYEDFASIEIAGRDVGGGSGGFIDNFDLPRLVIGPAAKVNLFDTVTNGNRGGPGGREALYVGTVEFEDPDGIINLNGYHLYYSTLIGNTSQIVDSGSGTGQYTPSWVCQTGNWSNPTCWSELDPGDPHPDNTTRTSYDVTLPPNGGVPYTVIVDGGAPDTEVIGVSLSVDTTLTLTSTNFRPGLLSNSGVVELTNDYLYLTQPIVNDGMIRFDTDTSAEYIRVQQQDVTLSGTGTLLFPDISTTSTSVHYVYGARLLTNGPDHTIEGGPGTIDDGLVNNGTVRANVPGKTLQLNDQIVENNGLVEAVGGGRLYFTSVDEIENSGAITCDASSVIELYNTHTALAGVVTIDGILQGTSSSITFDGTTGSGTGSFITNNSVTFATGTTIEFGTVDHSYTIAVHDGATVTVVDQYTHSLTTESYHNFNSTGTLRVIGGTQGNPCDVPTLARIEVAGYDEDDIPEGYVDNFDLPRLVIAPGAKVALVDDIDNGNRGGPGGAGEALYVETLEFQDATGRIVLNDLHLYYGTLIGDVAQIGTGEDCNENQNPDECDIAEGISQDCNANGIPDECDIAGSASDDCNLNGTPDECEIEGGSAEDCNENGVPDECDIAGGVSQDTNENGVPDECEEDCNENGIPDSEDIASGSSEDCNANGFPDECEMGFDTYTWIGPDGGLFNDPVNWSPTGVPAGDAVITNAGAQDNRSVLSAPGLTTVCSLALDTTGSGRQILRINGASQLRPVNGLTLDSNTSLELRGGSLESLTVTSTDGTVTGYGGLVADVVNGGSIDATAGGDLLITGATLSNPAAGTLRVSFGGFLNVQSTSVTQNGLIEIEPLGGALFASPLVNESAAVISLLGGALGTPLLTNALDADILGFGLVSADVANNGDVTIIADTELVGDLANEGTVTIQSGLLTIVGSLSGGGTIIGDFSGGPAPVERREGFSLTGAGGGSSGPGDASLNGLVVLGDCASGATASIAIAEGVLRVGGAFDIAVDDPARCMLTRGTLQLVGVSESDPQTLEMPARDADATVILPAPELFSIGTLQIGPTPTTVVLVDAHDNSAGAGPESLYVDALVLDPGITLDLAGHRIYYTTVIPEDPFRPESGVTVIDSVGGGDLIPLDYDGDGFPNALDNCPRVFNPGQVDTNMDGVGDACDCNDNGIDDYDDIASGTSQDCNLNGTPDECDLDSGASEDCNENSIPDECDIDSGTSEDCNENGVPDDCDIAEGTSEDRNEDGIPDECQEVYGDVNGDGLVNFGDLLLVLGAWGECSGCPEDLNDDGVVNFGDILVILSNWSTGNAPLWPAGEVGTVAFPTDAAGPRPVETSTGGESDEWMLINDGVLAPAEEGGVVEVHGSYLQTESGTLIVEIGGAIPVEDFDLLVVGGRASIDGTLELIAIDEFPPQPGDEFTIIVAERVEGRFARVILPGQFEIATNLRSQTRWSVHHGPDTVVVRVQGDGALAPDDVAPPYVAPTSLRGALAGDLTGDAVVDVWDVLSLLRDWGGSPLPGDLNRDGVVDGLDLMIVLDDWARARSVRGTSLVSP